MTKFYAEFSNFMQNLIYWKLDVVRKLGNFRGVEGVQKYYWPHHWFVVPSISYAQ